MFRMLISFYTRRILRSVVFLGSCVLVLAILIAMRVVVDVDPQDFQNYLVRFDNYAYAEVLLFSIFFIVSAWVYQEESDLESMAFCSADVVFWSKTCALSRCALLYLFFPLGFMLVGAWYDRPTVGYIFGNAVYACLRWFIFLVLAASIAALASRFFKTKILYLLAFPMTLIFSALNEYVFQYAFRDFSVAQKISEFFSVHRFFIHGFVVSFAGPGLEPLFYYKLLYFFALSAVFFVLGGEALRPKRWRYGIWLLPALALFGIGVWRWNAYFPEIYSPEKLMRPVFSQNLKLLEIRGEIGLGHRLQADLHIKCAALDKNVRFRLDEAFEVSALTVDGESVPFEREGDLCTVHLEKAGEMEMRIAYAGIVSYLDRTSVQDLFVTRRAAALPGGFSWMPSSGGDEVFDVDLLVDAGNTVSTNVSTTHVDGTLYRVQGKTSRLSLISGYIREDSVDGFRLVSDRYDRSRRSFVMEKGSGVFNRYVDGDTWTLHRETPKVDTLFWLNLYYNQQGPTVIWDNAGFLRR